MELVILLFLPCHLLAHIILGFESIPPSFPPLLCSLSLARFLSRSLSCTLCFPFWESKGGGGGVVQKWVKLRGEQWPIVIRKWAQRLRGIFNWGIRYIWKGDVLRARRERSGDLVHILRQWWRMASFGFPFWKYTTSNSLNIEGADV